MHLRMPWWGPEALAWPPLLCCIALRMGGGGHTSEALVHLCVTCEWQSLHAMRPQTCYDLS